MGNNLTPYSLAIGQDNIYFLTPYFKFIKEMKMIMKIVMIYINIIFEIVKKILLKTYDYIKLIQIMIIKILLYIDGNDKKIY